jgi:hypothetical protein
LAVSLEAVSITGVYRAGIGYGHVLDVVMGFGPEPLVLLAKVRISSLLLAFMGRRPKQNRRLDTSLTSGPDTVADPAPNSLGRLPILL